MERKWFYERVASPAEAEGRTCFICGGRIAGESQPGHWVLKAVEDNPDADFVLEDGYAHAECTRRRLDAEGGGRFRLPEVPDVPGPRKRL